MTDLPQWAVERASRIFDALCHCITETPYGVALQADARDLIARALAEAAKPGWIPLAEYKLPDRFESAPCMWCYHAEQGWQRVGRYYAELGRWYYSGTNELSQWAQQPGEEPTHVMPLPAPPEVG